MSVLTVYSLDVSHIESSSTLIPADIVIFAKNKLDIELHSSYEKKNPERWVYLMYQLKDKTEYTDNLHIRQSTFSGKRFLII